MPKRTLMTRGRGKETKKLTVMPLNDGEEDYSDTAVTGARKGSGSGRLETPRQTASTRTRRGRPYFITPVATGQEHEPPIQPTSTKTGPIFRDRYINEAHTPQE
ncbi:hypothetical protein BC834DRAFT_632190 [Gloeopeniophorella convolvens]|nr:hypothetical protein BC834DRAFT_632190 [Gloeopeniophorella convolvens]